MPLTFLQTHIDQYLTANGTVMLRIYGRHKKDTLILHLEGFQPYFYIRCKNLESLIKNADFLAKLQCIFNTSNLNIKIVKIEKCLRSSLLGYSQSPVVFLKIYFSTVFNNNVKTFFENGFKIGEDNVYFEIYEAHVSNVMRFMVDKGIKGMCHLNLNRFTVIDCQKSDLDWQNMGSFVQNDDNNATISNSSSQDTSPVSKMEYSTTNDTHTALNDINKASSENLSSQQHASQVKDITTPTTDSSQSQTDIKRSFLDEFCSPVVLKAHVDDLTPFESDLQKLPALKILSFDIECIGTGNSFPDPQIDPVIQIGNVLCFSNDFNNVQKVIFCLGLTADIPDATVKSHDNEKDLLCSWYDFFMQSDCDIVTGYNIKGFDFNYLITRGKVLKIEHFENLGRHDYITRNECMYLRSNNGENNDNKDDSQSMNRYNSSNYAKTQQKFDKSIFDTPYKTDASIKITAPRNQLVASFDVYIPGRIVFDMLQIIRKDYNLRSYTLQSVSVHFLNEQKEDVPYSIMKELHTTSPETRRRIATYCIKDCLLPLILMNKLNIICNYSEMSKVTGVPIEYLFSRGQAIRVLGQILRKAIRMDYVVPQIRVENDQSFEGGFVMDPVKGYYNIPISVLDFSSLYPSIMITHNLCYTTLIKDKKAVKINENSKDEKKLNESTESLTNSKSLTNQSYSFDKSTLESTDVQSSNQSGSLCDSESIPSNYINQTKSLSCSDSVDKNSNPNTITPTVSCDFSIPDTLSLHDDVTKTPTGNLFVKSHIKKGLLPMVLEDLLSERKKTKNILKSTTDPELRASLDAKQLALKISANSVYGFTGAAQGQLCCLEISQSVTSFGRDMIVHTKNLVENTFQSTKVSHNPPKVIYGDTDSVMINFDEHDLHKVFELSQEVSAFVSKTFQKPISLEFEKVYFPFLLMNKKRYAGLIYTSPTTTSKIDTKGIETVRRDNCEMVRLVIETCLDLILMKRNVDLAKEYVKNTIKNLYQNQIDLNLLVISKTYKKPVNEYLSKQAHIELVEKLKKRNIFYNIGDRIQYIIVKGEKKSLSSENAEDPLYVLEHNMPIDIEYYMQNQLLKPLSRLFEPIVHNIQELISGEHTKIMKKEIRTTGLMSNFISKQTVCMHCKQIDTKKNPNYKSNLIDGRILCSNCIHKFEFYYLQTQQEFNEKKSVFNKCWVECQRCQGSLVNEVICENKDCAIFYKRTRVKKELAEIEKTYIKLSELEW